MDRIDPRMISALAKQLERRRAALADGAEHVGWKLGIGKRERIGGDIAVGHLTSRTVLAPGDSYSGGNARDLRADAEVYVELRDAIAPEATSADVLSAIGGYGAALELVDFVGLAGEPESIVETNIYHRAVAFGALHATLSEPLHARLVVNGDVRDAGEAGDLADRLVAAASVLAAAGESFRPGDRIITGNAVQVRVAPGDDVAAHFDGLGSVAVKVAALG